MGSRIQHITRSAKRRGATTIELAIVLLIFLALVFGMLDLGLGVLRYHLLAQAARQVARQAIVHGSMATPLGVWGPASYSGTGNDTAPLAQVVQPLLASFDLAEVTIRADWIDGGNQLQQRVRVTINSPYRPLFAFFVGSSNIPLEATSTMAIAH